MPTGQKRTYFSVKCKDCCVEWQMRSDAVKTWRGRCRKCNQIYMSKLPQTIEARIQNGVRIMSLYADKIVKRGPAHYMWKGGISTDVELLRNSKEVREWRYRVYGRDDFTCQSCKKRGGKLHADHIMPFSMFPDLRLSLENGRTLCVECHKIHGARVWRNVVKKYATSGVSF